MGKEALERVKRLILKGNLEKSKKIDVTDLKRLLLEDISYLSFEIIGTYGIAYHLKKYAGINTNILLNKCSFEHGPYFSRIVCQTEVTHHAKYILTYSPFREEVIRELTDIEPIAIGPYIAYTENYRSREYIEKIKKSIGRTLLIMPSHSTAKDNVNYNIKEFIQYIENVKKEFDTVMVCIHIEDLKKELWKPYKEMGYYIVSAGHTQSPYFLSRIKFIFCLADAFVANAVTTGIAFAMYMKIPIKLVQQKVDFNVISHNNEIELECESQADNAYKLFINSDFTISKEQMEFGNYVFGLENVKSKEEIKLLLNSLTRMNRCIER